MISDLFTPVTVDDAKASIYAQLERVGVKTANWKPGAVVRTIVAIVAVLVSTFSTLVALIASMGWLDTATGDWLTNKAKGDFGIDRIAATPARGTLRLTNTAGGSFTIAAGDTLVSNPSTGAEYRNVVAYTLLPLGSADVEFEATEGGAWTSSDAGTITNLISSMTGVTVTNLSALIGADEESDALLIARCKMAPAANSPAGPADVYSYAVRTVPRSDGTPTGITRSRTIANGATGGVRVICATATGSPLSADLTYLQDYIVRNVMGQCITVSVESAVPAAQSVSYVAYTSNPASNSTTDKAAASAALQTYVAAVPIGGYRIGGASGTLPREGLAGAIQSAIKGCFRVDVTVPAADVAVDPDGVIVLGTVSGSVQVERQQ